MFIFNYKKHSFAIKTTPSDAMEVLLFLSNEDFEIADNIKSYVSNADATLFVFDNKVSLGGLLPMEVFTIDADISLETLKFLKRNIIDDDKIKQKMKELSKTKNNMKL